MKFEQEFIQAIKEKPELASLDDAFVSQKLRAAFASYEPSIFDKYNSFKQCKRSSSAKKLISMVRKKLREVYGVFLQSPLSVFYSRARKEGFTPDIIRSCLQAHRSTLERFEYYDIFYNELFNHLFAMGLPEKFTLCDVACGANPFSYEYLPYTPYRYLACDLSSQDMDLVNAFFASKHVLGEAFACDVLNCDVQNLFGNQQIDVAFFLKTLDSFETVSRHSSKKLLAAFPADFLVISFPLQSIGQKEKIACEKRYWFEIFCKKQNWDFVSFSIPTEKIYVVKKHSTPS